MVETIETTITYLEMTEPRHRLVPPPANLKVMLVKLEKPTVHFYRYLYHAVGNDYAWTDRKATAYSDHLPVIADIALPD